MKVPGAVRVTRVDLALIALIVLISSIAYLAFSYSVEDPSAVRFLASLLPTMVPPGGTVTVTFSAKNTLWFNNRLDENAVNVVWTLPNVTLLSPCEWTPFGFAVYQGHYTDENLSSAKSLEAAQPGVWNCGIQVQSTVVLRPMASITGAIDLTGYWTGGTSNPFQGTFHQFPPGQYTVAAADEWGGLELLYFEVTVR